MSLTNGGLSLAGLIQTGGNYRGGGGEDVGSRNRVNRRGKEGSWGLWRSVKVTQPSRGRDEPRKEKRFKVLVPRATRPPFLRLITRQTETDEAEGERWRGETAVKIERDYMERRRENKEKEVQCQREGRARPRVEPDSTVRGTCSRLDHLLPPALIKFTTETDCDDAPL